MVRDQEVGGSNPLAPTRLDSTTHKQKRGLERAPKFFPSSTGALRFDAAGTSLCILHDNERLPVLDGVRYGLVAKTDDPAEALAIMDLLQKQIDAGKL